MSLAALLDRSAWFRSALLACGHSCYKPVRVEHVAAGQRLFTRGDSGDGLYCMLDALVRIGASAAGNEALPTVIEPVNWFGEVTLLDTGREPTTCMLNAIPNCFMCRASHSLGCSNGRPGIDLYSVCW